MQDASMILGVPWSLALSAARTERMPIVQELFADGPHAATRSWEIGDPTLGRERSTSLEIGLRRRAGPITASIDAFAAVFDGYIAEQPAGTVEDGFDAHRYASTGARFAGGEVEATWHAIDEAARHLLFTVSADFVRGADTDRGVPLPRVPAPSAPASAEGVRACPHQGAPEILDGPAPPGACPHQGLMTKSETARLRKASTSTASGEASKAA
jgi:iron complex outermembrane receptor protein